ncbi:MAG TPA: FAD-binding oxidoreductase [Candidatus Limnocylindrales bacterium]|nr:FAD-binding oxidoreductase [Candidatus Limnocylindrales bacterium]
MSGTPDVAVVGGGIVGTAAAAFLADAGARVRLYERTEIAAGASGRNSGIVQHPFDPILAGLYRVTIAEYRALAAEVDGFGLPSEPAGLLYVGRDGAIAQRTAAAWARAWPDSRPEVLAGAALHRLEPALADDLVACRLAIGFPVAPDAATRAFAAVATRRGVGTVIGDARPDVSGGQVVGVRVGGRTEPAGVVVIAAGPWAPDLIDPAGGWRPIRAVWGVVAGLALAEAPGHALEAIDIDIEPGLAIDSTGHVIRIEPSDAAVEFSLVPAPGSSALGSTFLPAEPEPAAWLAALRRVGSRYVPAVADAPLVGLRHCARPVSADGRPLVGAIDGVAGLFVAAGHGPWGISTGPATARLVTDLILGRIGRGDVPEALDPGRFGPIQRQDSGSSR